ncbi:hypothetical protein D9M73_167800 [compost metagenome]
MGEATALGPLVERGNGVGAEGAEAHGRDIEDRGGVRLATLRTTDGDTERGGIGGICWQHRMADELEAGPVDIVERTEGLLGAFILGPGVDQRALGARERQLVVITLKQVLANFRADGFDQVTDVAQNRIVAPYRMVALAQVVQANQAEQGADQGEGPEPGMTRKKGQADAGEEQAAGQTGVAAGKRSFHESSTDMRDPAKDRASARAENP